MSLCASYNKHAGSAISFIIVVVLFFSSDLSSVFVAWATAAF